MFRLLTIGIVATFLLIPIAGFSSNIVGDSWLLIVVSFVTGYVIVPAILLRLWPDKRNEPESMESALSEGRLLSNQYEVSAAISIRHYEGDGEQFLLDIQDGVTLSLWSELLSGGVKRGDFPSDRIRVYRNLVTDTLYGIERLGQPVECIDEIPVDVLIDFEPDLFGGDFATVNLPSEQLSAKLADHKIKYEEVA